MDQYLEKIYTDPKSPSAFSSVQRLYHEAKKKYPNVKLEKIKNFLKHQPSYTLHKPVYRNFKRAKVITNGLSEQFDLDLADVSNRSTVNDGVKFLLVLVDNFSRFAMVKPLKSKKAKAVATAMETILLENPSRQPKNIRHDEGGEFVNRDFSALMKKFGINNYTTKSAVKANFAERFIRTLKSRLERLQTHTKTKRYIDNLKDVVDAYNNSYHSSIKMTPSSVNEENESVLWQQLYLDQPKQTQQRTNKHHKYRKGTTVRVSLRKKPFEKGYTKNWSDAVYKISERLYRGNKPIYQLEDLYGRPYKNKYYEQELQPVAVDENKQIAEIKQTRVRKGQKQYLVRWLNYGPQYDAWVTQEVLEKYT